MLRLMFPGLTYAHIAIPLKKEGMFADAQTGEKHTLVPPGHLKRCGTPQCEAVAEPILSALTCIDYKTKSLIYAVFRAETVNNKGLCFDSTPVFEAILSKDGTLQQTGEKTVRYWVKDGSDKLTQGLFQGASVTPERACQVLFGKSADEVFGRRREQTTDTLFLMALNGLLRFRTPQVRAVPVRWSAGVEVEFTGMSTKCAARAVANVLGGVVSSSGGYSTKDHYGRIWKITTDGSIRAQNGQISTNDRNFRCELVTPVFHSEQEVKELLQPVIRGLRRAGAVVNSSCGIHCHVSFEGFSNEDNAAMLIGVSKIIAANEDLLYAALDVNEGRKNRYAKKLDPGFMREIGGCRTLDEVSRAWYGGETRSSHYDNTRYHGLNFHSFFFDKKGIEFRYFNSSLHAGVVRAIVMLCVEICRKGTAMRRVPNTRYSAISEEAMLAFLDSLCITDRNARMHLTAALRTQAERRTAA